MSRVLAALGLLLLALVALGAVVGYLAYGTEPARSGRLTLEGLEQPASVGWSADGVVIEAADERGLAAALGYVHGVDAAWALALWRQAALGGLAAWFGEDYVPYDRHARTLGLAALARETYRALPDSARALLDAYARGVNGALRQDAVAQRDEFVLLDVAPEPFEPWHALAVERLLAWLGTPAPRTPDAGAVPDLARFARTDSLFRAYLHLDGAGQSRAWAARLDSAGAAFVQQQAYGASALPLVREVTVRLGGRAATLATVPGTLVFPGGLNDGYGWSVFLTSPAALSATEGGPPPPVYDRLVDRAGREELLAIHRSREALFFEGRAPAPPPADTLRADTLAADTTAAPAPVPVAATPQTWALRWPGFAPGTDLGAWWALVRGRSPAFRLFRGDGLLAARDGEATVLGQPPVREPLPGGVFVAADTLARFAHERLAGFLAAADTLARPLAPEVLVTDACSPWAAARLPRLLAALGHRDSLAADLKDPYAFLLSWDACYSPDAIGASIFETWIDAHREELGAIPIEADSLSRVLLQQTLRLSVAILETRHGERPSAWQWANVQPGTRFFPMWSDSGGPGGAAAARYAPAPRGPGGHPTAPLLGPSRVFGEPPAPAVWTAWTTSTDWDALTVRHPTVEPGAARLRHDDAVTPRRLPRDAAPPDPLVLRPSRE